MHGLLSAEQFDAYLAPLSEVSPAGEYLKGNRTLYRPLRNAYNIAQTSLQKLSLNPDPEELDDLVVSNKENWLQLQSLLLEVLKDSAHDLEMMVWLAMTQLFTDKPYTQLAIVVQLIDRSLQVFGEHIQPYLPTEKLRSSDQEEAAKERSELQSRPLKLLFGESEDSCQIAIPLHMLPLVADIDFSSYQREEGNRNSLKESVRSVIATEKDEVVERINGIQDVLDALDALDETLEMHFKTVAMVAPGSRFFRQALESNLQALQELTDGLIVPWPPDIRKAVLEQSQSGITNSPDQEAVLDTEMSGSRSDCQNNTLQPEPEPEFSHSFNRDQAFHQLRLLSDFFQKTEPQSPVSYLLEKAIRWGYTPLPELMRELLQGNDNTLNRITELTGMNQIDKTPIPGQPAVGLSVIPQPDLRVNEMATRDLDIGQPEQSKAGDIEEQVPEMIPPLISEDIAETTVKQASAPLSSGPGGLSISNLNDLL